MLLGKKTNCLLAKDDVGKAKPTTRDLPQPAFHYGKPELLADRETAQDGEANLIKNLSLAQLLITVINCSHHDVEISQRIPASGPRTP